MILLVDNYDSFAFNLDRYLRRLGADVIVLRNDDRDLMLAAAKSQAIVVSPGPCGPEQAGQCVGLVQQYSGVKPILGICLGHQAIVHALGGRIIRAPKPVHGQARAMRLARSPLLTGIA
jgi:anthranilate synthase/aminodeoxychorismate synthase-like glutamine amidotransferase